MHTVSILRTHQNPLGGKSVFICAEMHDFFFEGWQGFWALTAHQDSPVSHGNESAFNDGLAERFGFQIDLLCKGTLRASRKVLVLDTG